MIPLHEYTAAHRFIIDVVAKEADFIDPVAVSVNPYYWPLLRAARKGRAIAIDGVLIHDWNPGNRKAYPGIRLGARLYEVARVRFVNVHFTFDFNIDDAGFHFVVVERGQYLKLYRLALRAFRQTEPGSEPPVLPQEQADNLWKNTIGYLENENLERIQAYGGRARRGVLLTGPPGNGKTMACRWIWEECWRRRWEFRIVTPSTYRQARQSCDAEGAIRNLFSVQRRGVIFFDDMDLALRDRDRTDDTDDQAVFLTALDGIGIKEGVVYVFTTNCPLDRVDRAFKRPGRIDLALHFQAPDAPLRQRLLERWHPHIRASLDMEEAVEATAGFSFAEIEELRNLLIMHFAETETWDWTWALEQFALNREDLRARIKGSLGFTLPELQANGWTHDEE